VPSYTKVRDRDSRSGARKKVSRCWWTAKETVVAAELFATAAAIRRDLAGQRREERHLMLMYGNLNVTGLEGSRASGDRRMESRQRYNLCKSAVDTAQSVIAQQRPRPQYLTTDGDWGQQRQARLLTRVLEGQLHDQGMYEIGPDCQRDGAVNGSGFVYGYLDPETDEPALERILPLEVLVDHNDGMRRKPRSMYWKRAFPRDTLLALYGSDPVKKKAIESAPPPGSDDREDLFLSYNENIDQVVLLEAWHLPSSKDAKDGRHVIALSSGVLVCEEYNERRIPISAYRWQTRQSGFFGAGIVEEVRDAQWRINQLIKKNERLGDLGTNALLMAPRGAKVRIEQFTNQPLKVIEYEGGVEPHLQVNNAQPPTIQLEIEQIKAEAFQQLGLSQMATQGEKPAGLDSGKAIRAYEDVASRRHLINGRIYEDFFMDVVDLLEMLNEQAAKVNPAYKVRARSTRGRQTVVSQVKWSEVRMEKNKYVLQMWPTSALPSTPAGKWAAVQEWIDSGFVSRPFAISLLDFPDLDASVRIELADLDAVMFDVEKIMDGEDRLPTAYQDLAMAADVARRSLLQARVMNAPPEVVMSLEDYIESAMSQQAAATAASAPPAPPMMDPAMMADPAMMDLSLAAPAAPPPGL
jgi:hypothetical protein